MVDEFIRRFPEEVADALEKAPAEEVLELLRKTPVLQAVEILRCVDPDSVPAE